MGTGETRSWVLELQGGQGTLLRPQAGTSHLRRLRENQEDPVQVLELQELQGGTGDLAKTPSREEAP